MAKPDTQNEPQVHLAWGDPAGMPLVVADLLHWRTTADRCILTVGQMDLPLFEGPIPLGAEIPIKPVARFVLTPETAKMWAAILQQVAEQFKPVKTK